MFVGRRNAGFPRDWRSVGNHADARGEVFGCIELFCDPKRRRSSNDGLSSIELEKRYALNG